MKEVFKTVSDIGSLCLGTNLDNLFYIPNGYGDCANVIFLGKEKPNKQEKYVGMVKSNGKLLIYQSDCPKEGCESYAIPKGIYEIYKRDNLYGVKFYFVEVNYE